MTTDLTTRMRSLGLGRLSIDKAMDFRPDLSITRCPTEIVNLHKGDTPAALLAAQAAYLCLCSVIV
jgi:hypothetical protein